MTTDAGRASVVVVVIVEVGVVMCDEAQTSAIRLI